MAACGITKYTESTPISGLGSDDHKASVLRKRKRMISNRESARRSRIRKKKHVDDLLGQVTQLVSDNKYMAINLKDTTLMFLKIESENSVLRAQFDELTSQFESLSEIINGVSLVTDYRENEVSITCGVDDEFVIHCNQHFMEDMFLI